MTDFPNFEAGTLVLWTNYIPDTPRPTLDLSFDTFQAETVSSSSMKVSKPSGSAGNARWCHESR